MLGLFQSKFLKTILSLLNSFIFSLITLVCIFGNFGFQASAVRFIPQLKSEEGDKQNLFLKKTGLFIFIYSALIGLLFLVPLSLQTFFIAILAIPFLSLIKFHSGVFKGLKMGSWALLYESTFKEGLLLVLFLFFITSGILSATGLNTLALLAFILIFICLLSLFHLNKIIPKKAPAPLKEESLKNWLKISYPMMFVIAAQTIILRSDVIMLGVFVENSELGAYSAAAKLAQAASIGFIAMNIYFSPLASEFFHSKDFKNLKKIYIKTGLFQFGLTLLFATTLYIIAHPLLSYFGAEYMTGLTALYILLLGYIINCLWGPVSFLMIMTEYEKEAMVFTFIAALINVILNIVLIKQYGITGAALATAITINLRNIINIIFIMRKGVLRESADG
jgi:O-antigen/teichoic acid export membrane protein